MFIAKCGNDSYVTKVFGAEVLIMDYITGYAILIFLLLILIGPIVFFSEYAFIETNPVTKASVQVALVVSKTLKKSDLINRSVWKWEKAEEERRQKEKNIMGFPTSQNAIDDMTDQEFISYAM